MKVLVAEDNEDSRNLLVKQLCALGHEVTAVSNGVDALQQALKEAPDILVTDILMPKMDGYQLCHEWKRNERLVDVPFIFYTATYTLEEDEKFALSLGASAFIRKPTEPDVFIKKLLEIFEKAKSGLLRPPEIAPPELSLYLSEYNKRIVTKLEKKMLDLESEVAIRMQAESELRHARQEWENIFQAIGHPTLLLDPDHNIIAANRVAIKATGRSEAELVGKKCWEIFHRTDQPPSGCPLEKMSKSGHLETAEMEIEALGGIFMASCTPVLDAAGKLEKVIHIATDVTEHRLAEESLRQSEERFRQFFENEPDYCYMVSPEGTILNVNKSALNALGYKKEELVGKPLRMVYAPESLPKMKQIFTQWQKTGAIEDEEMVILTKEGNKHIVLLSAGVITDKDGQRLSSVSVQKDITERKRAEEERKQLEQKAQIASRLASVGEMAAGVAHEINNPLTGVIGYAQLLMVREDIPADIGKDLAAINDGAQRVAGIVKRLLAFSRQTKPERKYVDINELIESTLALRAYQLRVNNIKVIIQLAPDLPETVADPGQLQQVFLNLIVNAETEMKLAHGKGKLAITTEKSDNTIKICVKDDGPGIKPEVMDRIFDPFFTTREIGQGTGLGLSLCYGIVAEHKGKIYAESELGKGATFIVELPIVTEAEPPKPIEPVVEGPVKVVKARILVVDDEKMIRDLVKRVLAGEGYEVDTVDNARDALKKIEGKRYNLVLIDIKMPGMDGIELYRRIQKIAKSLAKRVVFITGDMLGAGTEKFLSETKVAHIDKPFDAEQLRREVKRALSGDR